MQVMDRGYTKRGVQRGRKEGISEVKDLATMAVFPHEYTLCTQQAKLPPYLGIFKRIKSMNK